jgi:hypothetical protein
MNALRIYDADRAELRKAYEDIVAWQIQPTFGSDDKGEYFEFDIRTDAPFIRWLMDWKGNFSVDFDQLSPDELLALLELGQAKGD